MTAPLLDFQDFVSDVADTIARHLGTTDAEVEPVRTQPEARATQARGAMPDAFLLDHEKVIWHFPDTASRIIEEVP